jgi:HSP20 family protein
MSLREAMDRLLTEPFFETFRTGMAGAPWPAVDVRETNDAFIVEADVPGVRPEDIEVTIEGSTLVLRGRFGKEREERDEGYLYRERQAGSFVRSIALPAAVDTESISCTYDNGELEITLPKAPEARTRRIPIRSGAGGRIEAGPTPGGTRTIGREAGQETRQRFGSTEEGANRPG